jgi:hypothetical protein
MKTRLGFRKPSGRTFDRSTFDRSTKVIAQHDPETAA